MKPLDYDRDPRVRGPFETLALLGQGGMGRAYLARRLPLDGWDGSWEAAYRIADADAVSMGENSLAVLKTIRTDLLTDEDTSKVERIRARFVAEVDAIRSVVGPRIPAFLGASPEAAEPWLAMEYIAGPSLDTQVKQGGPITDVGAWAALGLGLVEALESVHGADLLHRDLKPGNVVLGPNGPVVLDFGLAVLAERQDFSNALTKTGVPMGTRAFMPWEQYADTKRVKASADVYAIGSTLFFTATGRTPYLGAPLQWAPDWQGVPADFLPLLGRLFAPVEAQRPGLADVRHELSAMLTSRGLSYDAAAQQLADIVVSAGLTPKLPTATLSEGPDPQVRERAQRAVDRGAAPDAPWLDDGLFDELSPDVDLGEDVREEDAAEADAGPHAQAHRARYTPTVPDPDATPTAPLPAPGPTKMYETESADPAPRKAQPTPLPGPSGPGQRRPVTPRSIPRPALKVADRLRRTYAHSENL